VFTYMNSMNNIVFAFNNQFNAPQIIGELNPQGMRQVMGMGIISTTIAFLFYSLVSCLGVFTFGVGDHQRETLILSMGLYRKSILVIASELAVMFSVLMAFEFHVYPNRQFYGYLIRKCRGRGPKEEETDTVFWGRSLTRWLDIAVAVGVVLFAILIALVIPSLKRLLDFGGAFSGAWISFVIPPLWIIALRRRKGVPFLSAGVLLCLALFVLGLFFVFFGTYAALMH